MNDRQRAQAAAAGTPGCQRHCGPAGAAAGWGAASGGGTKGGRGAAAGRDAAA